MEMTQLLQEPVHMKLHKSLRLWTLYVDLKEILGTLESTRAVYEWILDLKIANPQININHALLLEEHKYFEDDLTVYERGVKIFKYPHVSDIWSTYLSKYLKRYGETRLDGPRELFQDVIAEVPAEYVKPLYLQFAKLEEDCSQAKHAMKVYDQAVKAVPNNEKSVCEIYIACATKSFCAPKMREIFEEAIYSSLSDDAKKTMSMKYTELEKKLGEIHRFEVQHGNEDTYREMLRMKCNISPSYSQAHFILSIYDETWSDPYN